MSQKLIHTLNQLKNKLKKKPDYPPCVNNPLFYNDTECRICFNKTMCMNKLYAFCKCKNDLAWYHTDCLNEWILHKPFNKQKCNICGGQYKI